MVRAIQFIEGSKTDKVFKFFLNAKSATSKEVCSSLGIKKEHINGYLRELLRKGLIKRGAKRVQSKTRKCSSLVIYGLSELDIEQKRHQLNGEINQAEFLTGIKKHIRDYFQTIQKGYTLAEIMFYLRTIKGLENYENWDYVGTTIREMVQEGIIRRSPYRIPANQMIYGHKPGFVYGISDEAINDKIISMMPKEVKKAYFEIIQSNEIFPVDVLQRRFGVDEQTAKSWFAYRLIPIGKVKCFSYKQRRYYYNPSLPIEHVQERVPRIHEEEVKNAILENSTLGNAFEKQAIFYFVWYLILKRNRTIRLNKNFPKKIPSFFSREDLNNPEFVLLDENGKNTDNKPLVDVWSFDNEPFDYIVNTYDDVLESPSESYIISIKRDNNGKYLGVAGKRYIASMYGCLSAGISLDGRRLPKRQMVPVLIASSINSSRLFEFARQLGCEVFYRSRFQKIVDFCNKHGAVYSDDRVLQQMQEEFNLLEKYKNHEAVILGR